MFVQVIVYKVGPAGRQREKKRGQTFGFDCSADCVRPADCVWCCPHTVCTD